MNYKDQLKDKRWFEFRQKAFKHYEGCGCVGCGDYSNEGLHEIHHIRYISGLMAWEYDFKDVVPLCRGCHQYYHDTKNRLENLITNNSLFNPMDFIKIVDLFEIELIKFKKSIGGF